MYHIMRISLQITQLISLWRVMSMPKSVIDTQKENVIFKQ